MLTTLRKILGDKNNVRIMEYESYGDKMLFVGGSYYADNLLFAIDGSFFALDMEISEYEWKDDNTLVIVRKEHDNRKNT